MRSWKWRFETEFRSQPWIQTIAWRMWVHGSAGVVNQDIVGHDKTTEVEELVEMALCWKGHHDYHHLGFV